MLNAYVKKKNKKPLFSFLFKLTILQLVCIRITGELVKTDPWPHLQIRVVDDP